jgi:hypothetical protein
VKAGLFGFGPPSKLSTRPGLYVSQVVLVNVVNNAQFLAVHLAIGTGRWVVYPVSRTPDSDNNEARVPVRGARHTLLSADAHRVAYTEGLPNVRFGLEPAMLA